MPKIQEYQSQTNAPQVIQSQRVEGSQFDISKGVQQLGAGITDVGQMIQKRNEQDDVSTANADIASIHAQKTGELQELLRTADPNDKTVVDKFMQGYDDAVSQAEQKMQTRAGQQHFGNQNAQLRSHFVQSAVAGQAELAGVKAKEDAKTSIDQTSAALLNDPSSFQMAMQTRLQGIDAQVQTGQLSRQNADELKIHATRQFAVSAVRGWAELDPEQTKKDLSSGHWDQYLDGESKRQLFHEADQQITAKRLQDELAQRQAERAKGLAQTATQNDFIQRLQDGTLTPKDILKSNLDPVGGGSKEQFLNWIADSGEKKLKDDGAVVTSLFQRIHANDGDPNKIVDDKDLNAYLGKGIGFQTLNKLREEIHGNETDEGKALSAQKKMLWDLAESKLTKSNPMLGIKDANGDAQMLRWQAQYNEDFAAAKKKGIPNSQLFNPDSPEFLGNSIPRFVKTPQQIMKENVESIRPPSVPPPAQTPSPNGTGVQINDTPPPGKAAILPRKPGETAAQYMARKKAAGN